MAMVRKSKREILRFYISPPLREHKISIFSSAIFLPWLSGEFSLFPSRRLVEINMKDDGIMAKLGHHKELFANYWFFVAKSENQVIDHTHLFGNEIRNRKTAIKWPELVGIG